MSDYLFYMYSHRVITEVFHTNTACTNSNAAVNLYCYVC
jgi:hypothetical protein